MTDDLLDLALEELRVQARDPDGQRLLATCDDYYVRWDLAANTSLVEGVQRLLAGDAHLGVRSTLAMNRSLTRQLQQRLAADPEFDVRFSLLGVDGRVLDESIQLLLARDERSVVRTALAMEPSLSGNVQLVLARDASLGVREALATNPALVVSTALPTAFLGEFEAGRRLRDDRLASVDPAARAALMPGWEGTLADLVAACESFAPELV